MQSSYHQTCECQHFKGKEHNADGGQCHWFNLFQRHQLLQSLPAPCLSRISYAPSAPAPLISANNYGDTCLSPASPPNKSIPSSCWLPAGVASSYHTWSLSSGISHDPLKPCLDGAAESHHPLQGQQAALPSLGMALQPKLYGQDPNSPST